MKIRDTFIKSNRYIMQSKTRSLLTILSVAVGGTTLTLALGAGLGVIEVFNRELNNVEAEGTLTVFPAGDYGNQEQTNVKGLPEYEEPKLGYDSPASSGIIPILDAKDREYFNTLEAVRKTYFSYSISFDYVEIEGKSGKYTSNSTIYYPELKLELLAGDYPASKDETVVTEEYLETLGLDKQDQAEIEEIIGKQLKLTYRDIRDDVYTRTFEIVGVKSTGFSDVNSFYLTEEMLAEIQAEQFGADHPLVGSAQTAILVLDDATPETEKIVTDELDDTGYLYFNFAQLNQLAQSAGVYLTAGLVGFSSIVIFASLFGILNTMLMSVYERTKEIGLMKAIGMSNRSVFGLFAVEGAFIGFWGGLVGILSAIFVGMAIFNPLLRNYFENQGVDEPIQFVFPIVMLIPIVAFLTFISLVAALIPARKASKLDPIVALRYE